MKRVLRRASRQHWVVSREQALGDGMTERAISYALGKAEWRRIYPGVYLVNQAPLTWKGPVDGAVLWAGPGAVASRRSAAVLLGLKHGLKDVVEVTVPRRVNSRHGISVRYDPALPRRPKVFADSIPVTYVEDGSDLCDVLLFSAASEVVVDAVRRKLVTLVDLGKSPR